jgi:hypothetical protein
MVSLHYASPTQRVPHLKESRCASKRIFRDDGALRPLRLVDHQVTSTGAILATFAPADR